MSSFWETTGRYEDVELTFVVMGRTAVVFCVAVSIGENRHLRPVGRNAETAFHLFLLLGEHRIVRFLS